MIQPNEPIGNSSLHSWCRKLLRWVKSFEIQPGVGYKVRRSSSGVVLEIDGRGGGGGTTSVVGMTEYLFQQMHNEYISCSSSPATGLTVASADVAGGGTGYAVGNVLTVSGGVGTAATITVTSVSSGAITGVSVTTAGDYTIIPDTPNSPTGGAGHDATINLTFTGLTKVLKPYKLCKSTADVTIDGESVTYTSYSNAQSRTATCATIAVTEKITPRYCQGDVIHAITIDSRTITDDDSSSTSVTHLDINADGRAWAKVYNA